METEMNWTLETYRLDEIHTKFQLPCVVRTTEGFFSETELEGFSQGDIISINSRKVLHKVAAHFATDTKKFTDSPCDEDGYTVLSSCTEILVPLKYKGKLKVISPMKNYSSVKELTLDFPRYAKLRSNLSVETGEHRKVTIAAGTVIELDRIFPGKPGGHGKLVIYFQQLGKRVAVALPMNIKAYFRTEPDNNEYTVQEVVDRYNLPQIIKFVDDEIKRVYTQDLVDGIENMTTITDVLQLNRLVSKEVLIGHYKPIEGVESTDGDRFKKRTLIVLPLDNYEIRNIEVNVLIGDPDDTYSDIFLVRNVSNTEEIVDGSLYVDFTTSNGIMRISDKDDSHYYNETTETTTKTDDVTEEDEPPPIPPRRGKPHKTPPEVKQKPKVPHKTRAPLPKVEEPPQETYEVMLPSSPSAVGPTPNKYNSKQHEDEVPEAGGDYEIMTPEDLPVKPKSKPKPPNIVTQKQKSDEDELGDYEEITPPYSSHGSAMDFTLAGVNFNDQDKPNMKFQKNKKVIHNVLGNIFIKKKVANVKPKGKQVVTEIQSTEAEIQDKSNLGSWASDDIYEEVDENDMQDRVKKSITTDQKQATGCNKQKSKTKDLPVARVKPSSSVKDFHELSVIELSDRLVNAKLVSMAHECMKQKLDGAFFTDMTIENIKETFQLNGIDLLKFMRIKEDWIPPKD